MNTYKKQRATSSNSPTKEKYERQTHLSPNQIKKLTENSLVGFGANSRYLSELGIQTKRDGTLSINEKSFKEAVEKDPIIYDAIFNSSITD